MRGEKGGGGEGKVTHTSAAAVSPEKLDTTDIVVLPRSLSVCWVRAVGYEGKCPPSSAGAVTELQVRGNRIANRGTTACNKSIKARRAAYILKLL